MAQARSLCLLFIVLCGCTNRHAATDQDASAKSPTVKFEAEWVSIESPEKRLFLGEKRWSLQQLEPERHIVKGNVAVVEKLGMSSVRDVVLSSTRDNDTGAALEQFDGLKLILIRERNRLRVATLDSRECELNGVYEYAGDASPSKGFDSVEHWGQTTLEPTVSVENE